ncbi:hypothetical protein S245_001330 [Arachis hypogaea]
MCSIRLIFYTLTVFFKYLPFNQIYSYNILQLIIIMDIPPNEDLVLNDACNIQNMSLATDCDIITVDFGDQIGTTIPSAKDDIIINDDVIQSKDLNKSEELSSKVEDVLRSIETMKMILLD